MMMERWISVRNKTSKKVYKAKIVLIVSEPIMRLYRKVDIPTYITLYMPKTGEIIKKHYSDIHLFYKDWDFESYLEGGEEM